MRDVQNEKGTLNFPIDKVGIKGLKYPIRLRDKAHKSQHTVATINIYADLPHNFRGTHMSRFVEILNRFHREIAITNIGKILKAIKESLNSSAAHIELQFPYFIEKEAPVSQAKGLMEYQCRFIGFLETDTFLKDKITIYMGVTVPVNLLCPCSKEISEKGAHNQRGEIRVLVKFKGFLWLEDLIALIEDCASSPVYSLLKREDEKYVTENAYQNPTFVEDVARNVADRLENHPDIIWYSLEVESQESIHNHNAYAAIEKKVKPLPKEERKGL
ncbi:MAG: GTP cyclohydrolase FolE2 [candidate division WOR-3 bacterium]